MGRKNGNTQKKRRRDDRRDQRAAAPQDLRITEERTEGKAHAALMDPRSTNDLKDRLDGYQLAYYKAARMSVTSTKMIFIDEPAGTGKTTVAFMAAVEALRSGKVKRITYVRFPSKRGQRLGAIPGSLEEKEALYMQPAYEALAACGLQPEAVEFLKAKGLIRLCTDVTLRGTNIAEEFVIVDECQNAEDLEQLKLVLTRLHDSAKSVLIGDSGQKDGKVQLYYGLNAFQVYSIHMLKKEWAKRCRLFNNYRGEVAQHADAIGDTLKELQEAKAI